MCHPADSLLIWGQTVACSAAGRYPNDECGADGVVVPPPGFVNGLRLFESLEDRAVEQFVAKLAVEAFAAAILPGAS